MTRAASARRVRWSPVRKDFFFGFSIWFGAVVNPACSGTPRVRAFPDCRLFWQLYGPELTVAGVQGSRIEEGKMSNRKRVWLILPALGAAVVAAALWAVAMGVRIFR